MARFVTFNGITRFKPGGITKINAEALNQVLLSDNSIVALVGEAEGGAPGSTSGVIALFDPSRATAEFRSGPLVDAARLAFQSSNDPDVPGGASRVLMYKTNNSTQSTVSLPTEEATETVNSTSTSGGASTLIDTGLLGVFADDELNGKFIVLRPFTATAEVQVISDYDAAGQIITVPVGWSVAPVTDPYVVLDAEVYDVSEVSGGGTAVTWVNGGLTIDEHIGRTVFIRDDASTTFLRQITDNDATTLTVTPSLPTLSTGAYAEILPNAIDYTSIDSGAHTNNIEIDLDDGVVVASSIIATTEFEGLVETSSEVGGAVFLKLLYRGGSAAITDIVDAAPAVPNTASVFEVDAGGLVPGDHVGTQVFSADLQEFTTITANTANVITVSPPFSAVPADGTDIEIRTVTKGEMNVAGTAGVATSLSTIITGVAGDDLSIAFPAGMTLRQLASTINANANYVATIPSGINPDISVTADFDFGPNTTATVLNSENLTSEGLRQDNVALVNFYETTSEFVSAVRSTGGALDGCCPPNALVEPVLLTGGTRGTSTNGDFQTGLDALLLVRANSVVPLIDENLDNEGFGDDDVRSPFPSRATFASVAAQLGAHVVAARGSSNTERGSYMGLRGNRAALIAQANLFNDTDVQLVGQNPTALNVTGSLEEFGPRMLAVVAASMRAGVSEVGEPLTHKFLRVSGLTQDASWDPADVTDSAELIINGLLFAESIDGLGTRWVRDLTTHVQDDNLAFTEGSVRDAVRFVAFGLRTTLVNKFTGKKATPATAENVKDATVGFLQLAKNDNIIVDSTDPATGGTINAFHNIKVTINGDILKVNVGIFPVVGINFTLNEIFLQLPTQAA